MTEEENDLAEQLQDFQIEAEEDARFVKNLLIQGKELNDDEHERLVDIFEYTIGGYGTERI